MREGGGGGNVTTLVATVLKERNATNGVELEFLWSWNSTWQNYTCGLSAGATLQKCTNKFSGVFLFHSICCNSFFM